MDSVQTITRNWTPTTRYTLMTYAESVQCVHSVQGFFKLLYTILYTLLIISIFFIKKVWTVWTLWTHWGIC